MDFLNGYYVLYDAGNRITQHYQAGSHNGVDLGWNTERYTEEQNFNVYANSYGIVETVVDGLPNLPNSAGTVQSWGNYVRINHQNGYKSRYAHLAIGVSNYVQEGDVVNSNTLIGIMGNTGHSFGRHLHFEVSEGDLRINPEPFLERPINEYSPVITTRDNFPWVLYARKFRGGNR